MSHGLSWNSPIPELARANWAPEDALEYLPRSPIITCEPRQEIYGANQPCMKLYLIMDGRVKISRTTSGGRGVLFDIYEAEQFFGESAVLNLPHRAEDAFTLNKTTLMCWDTAVIEDAIMRSPRLGIAFMQMLVRRAMDFRDRIACCASSKTDKRLAVTLIRLAERSGTRLETGAIRIPPITHDLLAQYIGTTREVVTQHMNRFRRLGYLGYSRREIVISYRDGLLDAAAQASGIENAETSVSIRSFRAGAN